MRRNRRDRVAAMTREILRVEKRAACGHRGRHVIGNLALVEGARALGGDALERRGQRRKTDHVAFIRRRAVEQIMPGRAGIGLELADIAAPVPRHPRGHRKAAFGVADGRRQCAVEPEAAMRFQNRFPGIERARHGDGVDRIADLAHVLIAQCLERSLGAGAAGAVIAPHRFARLRHQAVAIAANAGHMRLDHAQGRHCRHRRVGRAAAGAQRLDGGQGRQRVRGRRHAFAGNHGRAAGELEIAAHSHSTVGDFRTGRVRRLRAPAQLFRARVRRLRARLRGFQPSPHAARNAASM